MTRSFKAWGVKWKSGSKPWKPLLNVWVDYVVLRSQSVALGTS